MTGTFFDRPIDVANRLDELGWTPDQLMDVVAAMVKARNDLELKTTPWELAGGWRGKRARAYGAKLDVHWA